jgi:hypothetical protein
MIYFRKRIKNENTSKKTTTTQKIEGSIKARH